MKTDTIRAEFVEFIPTFLKEGVLYVSEKYRTATHLCACGCGKKVVTPLKDDGWKMSVDGEGNVTLSPSIGSFNLQCKSHYFIRGGKIKWC